MTSPSHVASRPRLARASLAAIRAIAAPRPRRAYPSQLRAVCAQGRAQTLSWGSVAARARRRPARAQTSTALGGVGGPQGEAPSWEVKPSAPRSPEDRRGVGTPTGTNSITPFGGLTLLVSTNSDNEPVPARPFVSQSRMTRGVSDPCNRLHTFAGRREGTVQRLAIAR